MDEENQNLKTGLDGTQVDNNQPNFNQPMQEPQPNYNGPIQEPQPSYNQPMQESQPSYNQPVQEPQPSYTQPMQEPQPSYNQPVQNQQVNNQYAQTNDQSNQYNSNMNGQYNNQINPNAQEEKAPTILRVLCFFFPIIGLILYCVNSSTNKTYALSCGKPALAGFITGIAISVLMFILGLIISFTAAAMAL